MINCFLFIYLLFIILMFFKLITTRSLINKIIYLNSLTSISALFICLLGSFFNNGSFLDIAMIYFLLSFVASAAYLKYFH